MAEYTQEIEQNITALFNNISQRLTTEDMAAFTSGLLNFAVISAVPVW